MNAIEKIKRLESQINGKLKGNNILIKISSGKNKNKGKIYILKNKKINRVLEIEAISNCQVSIAENGKIIEKGLFRDNLGKWIYNLYNPVEYFYSFYGKRFNGKVLTREQVDLIANGYTLDNQPKIQDYLGPMFEEIDYGKIYLRYETQEIYNMLST